eukprot:332614-Rhodomonas_salina.1
MSGSQMRCCDRCQDRKCVAVTDGIRGSGYHRDQPPFAELRVLRAHSLELFWRNDHDGRLEAHNGRVLRARSPNAQHKADSDGERHSGWLPEGPLSLQPPDGQARRWCEGCLEVETTPASGHAGTAWPECVALRRSTPLLQNILTNCCDGLWGTIFEQRRIPESGQDGSIDVEQ